MSFLPPTLIWTYLVMCDRIEWSFFHLDHNKVIVFCIFFSVVSFIIFHEVGCKSNRTIILEVTSHLTIKCKPTTLTHSGDGLLMGMTAPTQSGHCRSGHCRSSPLFINSVRIDD